MARATFLFKRGVKGRDLECRQRLDDYTLTVTAEMVPQKTRMTARTFLLPGLWECVLIAYPGGVRSDKVTIGAK